MSNDNKQLADELYTLLKSLRRRMRMLTVAVVLMALALFMTVAVVFGYLVEYNAGDFLLQGGAATAAGIVGFAFGWFARWGS
jgi:hypothetical protein